MFREIFRRFVFLQVGGPGTELVAIDHYRINALRDIVANGTGQWRLRADVIADFKVPVVLTEDTGLESTQKLIASVYSNKV